MRLPVVSNGESISKSAVSAWRARPYTWRPTPVREALHSLPWLRQPARRCRKIASTSLLHPKVAPLDHLSSPCNSNDRARRKHYLYLFDATELSPMGALCSVHRGGHAPNEAPDQAYSPNSTHSP